MRFHWTKDQETLEKCHLEQYQQDQPLRDSTQSIYVDNVIGRGDNGVHKDMQVKPHQNF